MAHYAFVNAQGIVEQVIVAEKDVIDSGLFGSPSSWVQTSYNTYGGVHRNGGQPLRKNYASIGYTYDAKRDAFIPPKPTEDSILDEATCLWIVPESETSLIQESSINPSVEEVVTEPVVLEPLSSATQTI